MTSNFPISRRPARRSTLTLVLALAAAGLAGPCMAEQQSAGADARTASASVDFRIVIPERIQVVAGREEQDRGRQFTSRTRAVVDGREVVTLARP